MNYVKAMLYAYPHLSRIGEGYGDHIKNKAVLSHDGRVSTERLMEYLAGEILQKQKAEELKTILDKILSSLSDEEKLLLDARYFGKIDGVRRIFAAVKAGLADEKYRATPLWSERTYFRKQNALLKKIALRLKAQGVGEKEFLNDFAAVDGVSHIYRYLELGKDAAVSKKEKDFLSFLDRIR